MSMPKQRGTTEPVSLGDIVFEVCRPCPLPLAKEAGLEVPFVCRDNSTFLVVKPGAVAVAFADLCQVDAGLERAAVGLQQERHWVIIVRDHQFDPAIAALT